MKAKQYAEVFREKVKPDDTLSDKVSVLIDILYKMHIEAVELAKTRGVKTDAGLFPCLREVVQKLDAMMSILEPQYRLSQLRQTPKELYLSLLKKFFPEIYINIEVNL